jgi:mannose-6-phosphate isomerase-like protein (cupin superfamily)
LIVPENDDRNLRALLVPKVMAAKDRFDVNFERDYKPPQVGDWLETENVLPDALEPYFLRANTGPRWMLGGVMSRPFINASQCAGKFAISSIESSNQYAAGASPFKRWLTFPTVDHCFSVMEGVLRVRLKGEEDSTEVREGQTLVISAGQAFTLEFASRYVRAITFTNGPGIEHLIHTAGQAYASYVLPDQASACDEERLSVVCGELGLQIEV